MSAADAVRAAARTLAGVSDTPRLDAELLMAHALGVTREALLMRDDAEPPGFAALVARRLTHEPLAYIVGTRDFWTISLDVAPGVLIPRPDSETLINAAVAHYAGTSGPRRVLDLGTGSGALLLAALSIWPDATGVGVDASVAARAIATRNAARIAPARAAVVAGDWCAGIADSFDLVLCNPPYVECGAMLARGLAWEPESALYAGDDGLDDYRRLIPQLPGVMAERAIACIEIGHTQDVRVASLAHEAGFAVGRRRDLSGRTRCLLLCR